MPALRTGMLWKVRNNYQFEFCFNMVCDLFCLIVERSHRASAHLPT